MVETLRSALPREKDVGGAWGAAESGETYENHNPMRPEEVVSVSSLTRTRQMSTSQSNSPTRPTPMRYTAPDLPNHGGFGVFRRRSSSVVVGFSRLCKPVGQRHERHELVARRPSATAALVSPDQVPAFECLEPVLDASIADAATARRLRDRGQARDDVVPRAEVVEVAAAWRVARAPVRPAVEARPHSCAETTVATCTMVGAVPGGTCHPLAQIRQCHR